MKKNILFGALCLGIGYVSSRYYFRAKSKDDRYFQWYKLLYQWIIMHQDKKRIADYFKTCGYKNIAIYGMGEFGKLLLWELADTEINIACVIDQNAASITLPKNKVVTLNEVKENMDVIVITVIDKYDAIKMEAEKYVNVPIISLEEVLFSL